VTSGFMGWMPAFGAGIAGWFEGKSFLDPGIVLILGLPLLLAVGIFIWAAFFRKRRRPHEHRHHHSPPTGTGSSTEKKAWSSWFSRRRRRRRRRERGRNPTLAESGGLPPMRGEPPPETRT